MSSGSDAQRRPLSLVSRSTIATLLVLIGFLGITGFALDRAYAQAALAGPVAPALKEQAAGLPGIHFHGWLKHEEVQDVAARCHVLAFPSIREFGGGAVLEGMALGLAPLVVDYGGPADLVTPEVGIKVPLTDREGTTAALRQALERLAADPDQTARMGQAAKARVNDLFTWPRRAEQILTIYDWVLGRRPTRPEPIPHS